MPTSLVTGAAGFIGSHLVDALIDRGHEVVALDDLSGGFADNVHARATFVQASCVDHERLSRYTNNVIGSMNLINESVNHNVKRFIFTSSIAVYGKNQLPMREDLTPAPEDSYGIAKYAVELDLKASHEMFGLDYVIFRPHNVYGERQNTGDKYRNVIGIFMNQTLAGEPYTIFGDGEQKRAFSYIGDVAPILAESATLEGARNEIFNVGADSVCTVNQLAGAVMNAMGTRTEIRHLPARNEVVDAWSDHTKVQRVFGKQPETPLSEGLRRMAEWVRANGPRKSKPFEGIEIEKNLPASWAVRSS
jgi:UDP-glucose 4-epimerase